MCIIFSVYLFEGTDTLENKAKYQVVCWRLDHAPYRVVFLIRKARLSDLLHVLVLGRETTPVCVCVCMHVFGFWYRTALKS